MSSPAAAYSHFPGNKGGYASAAVGKGFGAGKGSKPYFDPVTGRACGKNAHLLYDRRYFDADGRYVGNNNQWSNWSHASSRPHQKGPTAPPGGKCWGPTHHAAAAGEFVSKSWGQTPAGGAGGSRAPTMSPKGGGYPSYNQSGGHSKPHYQETPMSSAPPPQNHEAQQRQRLPPPPPPPPPLLTAANSGTSTYNWIVHPQAAPFMNTPGSSASGGVSLLPALNDPALNVVNATNAGGTAAVNLVDATASATQSVPPATTNSVTTTSCASSTRENNTAACFPHQHLQMPTAATGNSSSSGLNGEAEKQEKASETMARTRTSARQETIPEDDVVVAGRRPRPEDIKGTTNNFYTGVEQGLTLPSSMPSNGSFPSEWLAANGLQEPPKGPTNQEPQNFQPPPQPAPMAPHWPQQEELRGGTNNLPQSNLQANMFLAAAAAASAAAYQGAAAAAAYNNTYNYNSTYNASYNSSYNASYNNGYNPPQPQQHPHHHQQHHSQPPIQLHHSQPPIFPPGMGIPPTMGVPPAPTTFEGLHTAHTAPMIPGGGSHSHSTQPSTQHDSFLQQPQHPGQSILPITVAEQVNLNAAANLIGSSVSTMQQLQAQHQLLLNLGGIIGHHQTMNLNHVGLLPPAAEVLAMNGGNQNPLLAATPGLGGNLPFAATAPPAGGSNFYHHPLTDRAAPFDPSLGINAAMAIAPPANRWPSNPAVPAYENGEFMKCLGDFPATSLGIGDANLVGGDWRLHYNPFVPMPGDYGDSLNNTFLHNRTEEEAEAAGVAVGGRDDVGGRQTSEEQQSNPAAGVGAEAHVAVGEGMQVANLPDQHAETDDARHQSGDPSAGDPQRSSPEHQRRLSTSSNQGTLSSPDHGRSPTRATRSPTSTSRNKNKKNRTRSVSDAALTLAGGLRGGPESMSEHQNLTERLGALPTGPEGKAPGQEALYVPCDAFETISEPEEVRAHALGTYNISSADPSCSSSEEVAEVADEEEDSRGGEDVINNGSCLKMNPFEGNSEPLKLASGLSPMSRKKRESPFRSYVVNELLPHVPRPTNFPPAKKMIGVEEENQNLQEPQDPHLRAGASCTAAFASLSTSPSLNASMASSGSRWTSSFVGNPSAAVEPPPANMVPSVLPVVACQTSVTSTETGQKAAARCISSDPTSSPDPAHHLHSEIVATVCFLDDAAAAKEAIARLRTEGVGEQKLAIAIDIEGDELCRDGNICLIQACNEQSPVYLFDVSVLGTTLFEECGMRELLEAEDLLKVVFDGRADNDALWHIHKVRSRNLYDIQVLYHLKYGQATHLYVVGLGRCIRSYANLEPGQRERIQRLKEAGSKLYVSEGWGKRPLHPMLLEYAACDVRYLLGMRDLWGQDAKLHQMVVRLTEKRIEQAIFGKTTPRGQHMMERDFVIPQDEQPMRAST